jgi:DNA-binding MarR family transcriptional regulator
LIPEDATATAGRISWALRTAIARLNHLLRARENPGGIGSTALSVLGRLHRSGTMPMGMLAAEERLQPQSLTRTIADLEERGLVSRAVDPSDRRRASIAITPAGVVRLIESVRRRSEWFARVMASELSETNATSSALRRPSWNGSLTPANATSILERRPHVGRTRRADRLI